MDNEEMLSVLTEILEEQKESARLLSSIQNSNNTLEARIDGLEEKINTLNTKKTSIDLSEVKTQMAERTNEIKTLLQALPTNTIQEKRFLLFPEHNAREYYSVVLRWLLYAFIVVCVFLLVRRWLNAIYHLPMN